MKNHQVARLFAIAVFTFIDIAMAFFIDSRSVLCQTIYGLSKSLIFIIFIDMIIVTDLQFRFLKIVVYSYWIGFSFLYIINGTKYKDFDEWLVNFNNYDTLSPVFIAVVLFAIAYSFKKLK